MDCYVSCQAELSGGCKVQCESPEGNMFCDGQFVDHGDNLAECIRALRAVLNIEVNAEGSAACEDGACTAEGKVECGSGSITPVRTSMPWYAAVPFGLLGLMLLRRRRH